MRLIDVKTFCCCMRDKFVKKAVRAAQEYDRTINLAISMAKNPQMVHADALAYIQQLENQSGKDTNVPCWISVKDGMPENEKSVLIATKRNFMGNNGLAVSCGFHTNGKSFTGNSYYNWDECYFDLSYEEEEDEYIVPEGWWESVRYSEQFSAVDEQVLYWMPLPGPPKDEEDEKKD